MNSEAELPEEKSRRIAAHDNNLLRRETFEALASVLSSYFPLDCLAVVVPEQEGKRLYAAIGASVNTVQEAQSLAFPVLSPLIMSMMLFPVVMRNPDSPLAVGLSLFPMATPLLMFLRITLQTPPWWQIALSILLTLGTIAFVTWAAARIYRVGILMYEKRPTFPEILRWVRHT